MDYLNALVKNLDNITYRRFKSHLLYKNKREDTKNIILLEIIKTDDIVGLETLYPAQKTNNGAYHALRKRLQDSLLQFLLVENKQTQQQEIHLAQQYLNLGKWLIEQQLTAIAIKQIQKAEAIAIANEQFGVLNDIYQLQLQFAHAVPSWNIAHIGSALLKNQVRLMQEGKLHIAYAHIRAQIAQIQLKNSTINLTDLIQSTMKQYELNLSSALSYSSIYQILHIANEYAGIYQDFSLIDSYIQQSQSFLASKKKLSQQQLYYRLYILYYLANYYLRNKQFEQSKAYLQQMPELWQEHKVYQQQFELRHQMLLSLALYFSGADKKAINIALTALENAKKSNQSEDLADLHSCLVLYYSQTNQSACLKHLAQLTQTDAWYEKRLGMLWVIRKNLMEIVVHAQFQNTELALSRLVSFKRRYKQFLKASNEQKVLDYIRLLEQLLQKTDLKFHSKYQEKVMAIIETQSNEDIFSISFFAWIIAHWRGQNAHQITLELMQNYKAQA